MLPCNTLGSKLFFLKCAYLQVLAMLTVANRQYHLLHRYPGGMFALYPARLPPAGKPLELEAGAVLGNDLLRRYRVRYSGDRRVQAVTLEEFRSPAQPGTR